MKKVFLALVAIFAAFCAQHLAAQTQINQSNLSSGPFYITSAGSYILTSNLVVTAQGSVAIVINSSNVTLNLNGYTVYGPLTCNGANCNSSQASIGIESIGTNNEILNGSISGFYYDVYITSGMVHDVRVSSTEFGIYASSSNIRHNAVSGSAQDGIYAQNSEINENVITGSYGVGIIAFNSSLLNNAVIGMNGSGISATSCTVMNNIVSNNTNNGIIMNTTGYAGGNTISNNSVSDLTLGGYSVSTKNNACSKGAC